MRLSSQGKAPVRLQAVLPGVTATGPWARIGVPAGMLPSEVEMQAADMVDAAAAGLDQGEVVTIPSLPDAQDPTPRTRGPGPDAQDPTPRTGTPTIQHDRTSSRNCPSGFRPAATAWARQRRTSSKRLSFKQQKTTAIRKPLKKTWHPLHPTDPPHKSKPTHLLLSAPSRHRNPLIPGDRK